MCEILTLYAKNFSAVMAVEICEFGPNLKKFSARILMILYSISSELKCDRIHVLGLVLRQILQEFQSKMSRFQGVSANVAEKRTFQVFTRKVFVVEHNRIHSCDRILIPERQSMISSKSETKNFSLLVQNRNFRRPLRQKKFWRRALKFCGCFLDAREHLI